MDQKIQTLPQVLRSRGIDGGEIETICGFVAYIDSIDAIDENLLDTDLPLAYEPQASTAEEKPPWSSIPTKQ